MGRKRPRKLPKVQTCTLVREGDGRWRIAAFHDTEGEALMFRFAPASAPSGARA